MKDGTLDTAGDRPLIRFERHLKHPPEAVWRALTEPGELTGWFPCAIRTDQWRVGATLSFEFADQPALTKTGTVLDYRPPHLLAYTWGEETLRYQLFEHADGGTRLVFSHELAPGIAARTAAGWDICLDLLAGLPVAETPWQPRFAHYAAEFTPTLGPQEGPPKEFLDKAT